MTQPRRSETSIHRAAMLWAIASLTAASAAGSAYFGAAAILRHDAFLAAFATLSVVAGILGTRHVLKSA